jgi:hypothetical protein
MSRLARLSALTLAPRTRCATCYDRDLILWPCPSLEARCNPANALLCCQCVGVYVNGRVEIIANDQGNRITPSVVAFSEGDRLIGESAKNQAALNPTNTVYDAKRLIGRKYVAITEFLCIAPSVPLHSWQIVQRCSLAFVIGTRTPPSRRTSACSRSRSSTKTPSRTSRLRSRARGSRSPRRRSAPWCC